MNDCISKSMLGNPCRCCERRAPTVTHDFGCPKTYEPPGICLCPMPKASPMPGQTCFVRHCVKPMPHTDHRDEDGLALPRPGCDAAADSSGQTTEIIRLRWLLESCLETEGMSASPDWRNQARLALRSWPFTSHEPKETP